MAGYDALVIGGGFAGLVAAREIAAQQKTVLLLEARNRVGGRTWVDEFDGIAIEKGGAWVHWSQPHVWAELRRYGIGIVQDAEPAECVAVGETGLVRGTPEEIWPKFERALARFFATANDALALPYDPLSENARFDEIDVLSIEDRMNQADLSADDRSLISGLLSSFAGSRNTEAAYSTLARWWALSGGNFASFWQAMLGFRIDGGTRALAEAIAMSPGITVRTGATVSRLNVEPNGVTAVLASGDEVSADVAVVATPVNTWTSMTFSPELSVERATASNVGWSARSGSKTIARVSGLDHRIYAQLPEGRPIPLLFTYMELSDGEQLLVGISGESTYDPHDADQVVKAIKEIAPGAEVISSFSHDWVGDPFSLGAWPFHVPGEVGKRLRVLAQPEGRLFFATSDIAAGWSGFIDGAIESGLRAADDARRFFLSQDV